MNFIDLFAGLGGFHQALAARDADCVFASELDPALSALYKKNFGIEPAGDIRLVELSKIPDHDVLCAGFPCQPFSKAGDQKGLECPQWGNLFDYVIDVLALKQPRYFIIENVPNLIRHDKGKTWELILARLEALDYNIDFERLSPIMFGIPQRRERAFIVGDRKTLAGFTWPVPETLPDVSIASVLDKKPRDALELNARQIAYLDTWQAFIEAFPKDEDLPSFPIWAMEFGATYPIEGATPHKLDYQGLGSFRGTLGKSLKGLEPEDVQGALPGYARTKLDSFPDWKVDFIRKNREFYARHKKIIDPWLPRIRDFPPSFQKLEWNCKGAKRNIWSHIIQFRASGIRVKKADAAPSLIAMTTSQVPIIAWEKRYMTPRECSRLQSMGSLQHLPETKDRAYKAFGNAVNVEVVGAIFDALVTNRQNADAAALCDTPEGDGEPAAYDVAAE